MHYRHTLEALVKAKGLIGTHLPQGAEPRSHDPAKLKRLVSLIDGETWIGLGVDVKGAIYEGLLEERRRGEVRRGSVLHAAPADRGDGRRVQPATRRDRP